MKKITLFILMLIPLFGLSGCNNDDSIPNVTVTVNLNNVADYQGNLYAVANDTISIEGIYIEGNNNKNAMISNVDYGWDNRYIGRNPFYPFGTKLIVNNPGNHLLSMRFDIAQVDKSLSVASMNLPVIVVDSPDSLPDNATLGDVSISYLIH